MFRQGVDRTKQGLNILPDVPTSKAVPLLWSPEAERTQSGSQSAHSGVKKPAFNLSVFGTSSSVSASSLQCCSLSAYVGVDGRFILLYLS